ncbi:MAG: hypothetical protein DLM65_11110 [Candidatus Aeolococcus gillhamiae]|uniref:Thioesterase domain-containing protein n=2 Tax=Candidatus Aeolococcus gillhamiae TaxID=3127015 RepID=A0A2W5Z229_9BACT|nr:MAG: hypothetical protein DLM65_11110 [Candidatus Dormibacter sp. RRmetagenome_bin12]
MLGSMTEGITPGERFADPRVWEADAVDGPHIWRTLGYRRTDWRPGSTSIEWTATAEYCFPTADGAVVQGGLVTALLDAAMGGACWTVLDLDQVFLTADLRVEFVRVSRPGLLSATGTVVRRTRRVVFCAAEMHDAAGALLASSRCTQVVLPNAGPFGRRGVADDSGAPPEDARG